MKFFFEGRIFESVSDLVDDILEKLTIQGSAEELMKDAGIKGMKAGQLLRKEYYATWLGDEK